MKYRNAFKDIQAQFGKYSYTSLNVHNPSVKNTTSVCMQDMSVDFSKADFVYYKTRMFHASHKCAI